MGSSDTAWGSVSLGTGIWLSRGSGRISVAMGLGGGLLAGRGGQRVCVDTPRGDHLGRLW